MGKALFLMLSPALAAGLGLPLEFEANHGQFAAQVLYVARTPSHFVYLTRSGMTLGINAADRPGSSLRMSLEGGGAVSVAGEERTLAVSNYVIGSDPARWRRGVGHYARVRYEGAWAGIDLVFHGRDQLLEYDFEVAPGSDPGTIRLRFENADSLRVDASG